MLLRENAKDIAKGEEKGMHPALLDRLRLTEERIKGMAEGLLQVAELPDPVGEIIETIERPNGLRIEKRRVPMGVIGMIYESRPNVTADAFGLCFKSGNAVILKGGVMRFAPILQLPESLDRHLKKKELRRMPFN